MRMPALTCACALLAGCATTQPSSLVSNQSAWEPTIDQTHLSRTRYERDLAQCRELVVNTKGTDGVTAGKKSAAKFGLGYLGLMGAATVATGGLALLPAMAGGLAMGGGTLAVLGGANAKASADSKYRGMLSTCLKERGYHVLG